MPGDKRVFVTRAVPEVGLEIISGECVVDLWDGTMPPPKEELIRRTRGADGLLCLLTDPVDRDVVLAGDRLKVISNYAVGYDNIDVDCATSASIPVGNTPGVLTETTADLAFSLLMCAARRLVEGADFARAGKWKTWSPKLLLGVDVYGATLGIVGMGRIGRAVARRADGFGMEVLYTNDDDVSAVEGAVRVELPELLTRSDFVSLHVPFTPKTANMIDRRALGAMKPTSVLINTSRGGVVDHDALFEALADGQIGYAALDVTNPEPLPGGHSLHGLPNCLVVPHLGSASVATRDRMAVMAAQNLLAGLRGERLPHCVNPQVYEK